MAGLAATLGGCAQVGPVLPPSAGLPKPVNDFSAVRAGPRVRLDWTAPTRTSDGAAWRGRGVVAYNLCAWPGVESGRVPPPPQLPASPIPPQIPAPPPSGAGSEATPAGKIMPACPRPQELGAVDAPVIVALPRFAAGFATLALYAVNRNGEGAGWSNPVVVPLTPVAPPPELVAATPTAQGVELRWRASPAEEVAIYRNGDVLATADAGETSYLDTTAAWNQPYVYFLRSRAGQERSMVESSDSNRLEVTPKDVFPPPVPTGVQIVVGTGGVDLSWDAVSAKDLAGYNVYRRITREGWEKRNSSLLPTPVFHDSLPAGVPAADYAVTAVDQSGNESARSSPGIAHF